MRPVIFFIFTVFAHPCFSQKSNEQEAPPPYKFLELNHGLSAKKNSAGKDSSVWNRPRYEFKVIQTTDSVPAKLNTVFGVEFKITGKETSDLVYTREWIYPAPMLEEDGRKYGAVKTKATMSTNTVTNTYFTFSEPYELIKGKWKLNIYIENKLVFTRIFIMY